MRNREILTGQCQLLYGKKKNISVGTNKTYVHKYVCEIEICVENSTVDRFIYNFIIRYSNKQICCRYSIEFSHRGVLLLTI